MRLRPQPCANIIANGISAARPELRPLFRRRLVLRPAATRPQSNPARALARARTRAYYERGVPGSSSGSNLCSITDNTNTTTTTLAIMGSSSSNKRQASTSAAAPSLAKKRKMDNVQKYYAVQAGFVPGVYLTYSECQAQTAGFKGAVCELLAFSSSSFFFSPSYRRDNELVSNHFGHPQSSLSCHEKTPKRLPPGKKLR